MTQETRKETGQSLNQTLLFSSTDEFQAFWDSSLRGRQREGSALAEERELGDLDWPKNQCHQMDVRNLQCRVKI